MKDKIAAVNTAGTATGMTTFRSVCSRVAPSTSAASSSSAGICSKKFFSSQVAIGSV